MHTGLEAGTGVEIRNITPLSTKVRAQYMDAEFSIIYNCNRLYTPKAVRRQQWTGQ